MKLAKLKKIIHSYKIDGYLIPKNDEFFGEYVPANKDNLKFISNAKISSKAKGLIAVNFFIIFIE